MDTFFTLIIFFAIFKLLWILVGLIILDRNPEFEGQPVPWMLLWPILTIKELHKRYKERNPNA